MLRRAAEPKSGRCTELWRRTQTRNWFVEGLLQLRALPGAAVVPHSCGPEPCLLRVSDANAVRASAAVTFVPLLVFTVKFLEGTIPRWA